MNAQPTSPLTTSAWPQSALLARARQLAAELVDQAAVIIDLQRHYPGQPSPAHYANPAAMAVMDRVRAMQRERQRHELHNAWRASRGMPELPAEHEEAREPQTAELERITNGRDLLLLCRRYGIEIAYDDADGALQVSRPIDKDGALADAIRRFRSSLVKLQAPLRAGP